MIWLKKYSPYGLVFIYCIWLDSNQRRLYEKRIMSPVPSATWLQMRLELVGFEPTSTKVFKLLFYPDNVLHINLNQIIL